MTQETIMGMRPDNLIAELRQMVESARERKDPTLSIALSVEAVAFLLDRLECYEAGLREVETVLGPSPHLHPPGHCEGCKMEITFALEAVRDALEAKV